MDTNLLDSFIEVQLVNKDNFLLVKETLSRIGVASRRNNILYPSCHIFHKKGKLYIVHFKELLALDGRETDFSDEDKARRNTIAYLLQEWNLIKIREDIDISMQVPVSTIKIISHKEKQNWQIIPKYTIGSRR